MPEAKRTLRDFKHLLAAGVDSTQLPDDHARWLLRWVFIAGFLAQGVAPLSDYIWHLADSSHRIFYGSTFVNIAIGLIWLLALAFVNVVPIRTATWTSVLLTLLVTMVQVFVLGGVLSSSVVLMAIPMLLAVIFLNLRDSFLVLLVVLSWMIGTIFLEQQWGFRGPNLYASHTEISYVVVMAQGIVGVWLLLWLGIGLTRSMVRGTQVAQLRAEISAREKDDLVAHISHELRTPLTNILGFVDLLQYQESAWDRSTMRAVYDNAVTLLTMVNNLLGYSKLHSGGMAFEARACNVLEVIAEVCAMHAAPVQRAGNTLTVRCEPEVFPEVKVDHEALSRIVSNLISNANKYTENGTISVEIQYEVSRLLISVKDSGVGMDGETLAHIFEPFYQAQDARPGTGLGLTLVSSLAQRLGGKVSVVSRPGQGSQFTVEIPSDADWSIVSSYQQVEAKRNQDRGQKTIPSVDEKARNASIVFVEDQADIRMMIELFLQSLELQACIASDWDDLEADMPAKIDMAFLDLQLPHVDGNEAARRLRQKFPGAKLFAMTANLNFRPTDSSDFDGVLYKPFTMQQLAQILTDESLLD